MWFVIILVITYIKNIKLTFLFENKNLHKIHFNKKIEFNYYKFSDLQFIFLSIKKTKSKVREI